MRLSKTAFDAVVRKAMRRVRLFREDIREINHILTVCDMQSLKTDTDIRRARPQGATKEKYMIFLWNKYKKNLDENHP